jgi:hypothetical protein
MWGNDKDIGRRRADAAIARSDCDRVEVESLVIEAAQALARRQRDEAVRLLRRLRVEYRLPLRLGVSREVTP